MQLVVGPSGTVRCLYGEAIDLKQIGQVDVRRGSHVEPLAGGQWSADLSPVGGPMLMGFATRSEALSAEEAWLIAHWLTN
jgi:hypothetical protein